MFVIHAIGMEWFLDVSAMKGLKVSTAKKVCLTVVPRVSRGASKQFGERFFGLIEAFAECRTPLLDP